MQVEGIVISNPLGMTSPIAFSAIASWCFLPSFTSHHCCSSSCYLEFLTSTPYTCKTEVWPKKKKQHPKNKHSRAILAPLVF